VCFNESSAASDASVGAQRAAPQLARAYESTLLFLVVLGFQWITFPNCFVSQNAYLAGTFCLLATLPVVSTKTRAMQDALPAFVLDSEAAKHNAMGETPRHPHTESLETTGSDEQLMVAFSKGSADAFNGLFSRYKQPLFGFFRRRLADPSQAEELTQETFLVIVRSASRYQPTALFRTYLYAIALKILQAHRRKAAFRAAFWVAAASREPVVQNTSDVEVALRHAVGKLEPTDREILMLREFEQLKYEEIAKVLDLPVNTVRSRLFRARTALRDMLAAPAPKITPELSKSEGIL
jgi:RNA polymerase sigma-70 factor (ECF subfamily)